MQTTQEIRRIGPGDQIVLTDEQTISDLIDSGADNAMDGLSLEVRRVRHIRESDGIADWFLADLSGGDIPLFFMAKIVDQEMDLRVYYQPDDIAAGTRQDQLDGGNTWIFEEPEDEDKDVAPNELDITRRFEQPIDGSVVEFDIKGGTLFGELREYPVPSGINQPQFVAVSEYSTDREIENPEFVIFEIGGLDEDGDQLPEGGLVLALQGANVDPNDLSLLPI